MDLPTAQKQADRLMSATSDAPDQALLCKELERTFMSRFYRGKQPDLEYPKILCRLALSSDPLTAETAVKYLYNRIIEQLCDDFSERGAQLAARILAYIVPATIDKLGESKMAAILYQRGLDTEDKLLKNLHATDSRQNVCFSRQERIGKIIILSRVTVGADIAITGVMARRLSAAFPAAELVFIGPKHLPQLFHDLPHCRFLSLDYIRRGSIHDKIAFWPELVEMVENESSTCRQGEVLVFDPDTRLTQLGLLPPCPPERYFHFNSRTRKPEGASPGLTVIVNEWLDQILGKQALVYPWVSLLAEHEEKAATFCGMLRNNGCRQIISINFGVGNDQRKRIADPFEDEVLQTLLQQENTIILLDTGIGTEEKNRAENLLQAAAARNVRTSLSSESVLAAARIDYAHGIVALRASIGMFGALIDKSDGFVGYDSCCQHLANALEVPACIVFTGHRNERFLDRWSPANAAETTTIIPVSEHIFDIKQIRALAGKVHDCMTA